MVTTCGILTYHSVNISLVTPGKYQCHLSFVGAIFHSYLRKDRHISNGKKIAQFLMYLFKTNHGFWKLEASIVYIYIGILTHAYLVAMVVQYPFLN